MAVEGGLKLVKYLVFFFNFIFWLCGLALIVIGVLVQISLHNTLMIKDASGSGAPILLIALGVIVFLISFFGCCGAWKENFCMITMLKCCGVNSSADWRGFSPEGNTVPDSCCITVTQGCGEGTMSDASKVYQKGCQEAVEAILQENVKWIIVAALVIAVLQILGVVFACLLMRGIRSGYEVM
uniref:Tetraspanin n=1 Tax=Periophthalmus magnuspinnatus TaxID=409849 RepID=A0A3B4BK26_9GOBI